MCVTTLTHTILSGFLQFLRCCHRCVWSHLFHEDVVDKFTAVICQLTPHYRRTISIPMVDHLLSELRSRFSDHQRRAMLGLSIVPSLFVSLESADHIFRIKELADLYEKDLTSPECLESELHSWRIKWQQQQKDHGERSLPTSLTLTC